MEKKTKKELSKKQRECCSGGTKPNRKNSAEPYVPVPRILPTPTIVDFATVITNPKILAREAAEMRVDDPEESFFRARVDEE